MWAQVWRKALAAQENGQPLLREKSGRAAKQRMNVYESAVRSVHGHQEWRKAKKTVEDLIDINSPSLNVGWKLEEQFLTLRGGWQQLPSRDAS